MSMPGFTAESGFGGRDRHSRFRAAQLARVSADGTILPQRLGYVCEGRYCDCSGTTDCADMINKKCGGWTRCVVVNGALRCLCEPRIARG